MENFLLREHEIQRKIKEITNTLTNNIHLVNTSSLYGGKSGLSVYFAYLSKLEKTEEYNSTISDLISSSFESINQDFTLPTYSFGISGILWAIHHLNSEGFINADDFFEEVIPFLGDQMILYSKDSDFDYIHGSIGIGFYLMHFQDKANQNYLNKLIEILQQKGVSKNNAIKWKSVINSGDQKVYNLSLSHGISSIIIFLSHLVRRIPHQVKARNILEQSVNYLLSQKNRAEDNSISLFPDYGEEIELSNNSRLSWCYGDLGIAVAFWQAGKTLNKEIWKQEAVNIMLHSVARRDLKMNHIVDAGICHGTTGIAHIFNRFYWETKEQVFKEAANYWIDETLKLAVFDDGLAGFKAWQGEEGWKNEYGILEGISGIGLVLISHILNEEPTWDRCLLLS